MNTRLPLTLSALALIAAAHADYGDFAASFDTGSPMFTRSYTVGTLGTVSATGTGLTLDAYNRSSPYTNVSFVMEPISFQASSTAAQAPALTLNAGSIRFFDATDPNLLTITFDIANLNSTGFFASYNDGGLDDGVRFGGTIGSGIDSQQGFQFSFANFQNNNGVVTYSSQFSSSGVFTPVPEPASMAALGLGALALVRRRRSR